MQPNPAPLSAGELAALAQFCTPTIANAIETFGIRPNNEGFMGPEIKAIFPDPGVVVGYACTGRIVAATAPDQGMPGIPEEDYWRAALQVPAPRVAVIQDLDPTPVGSLWGEVNSNIHRALGCLGVVTNGGVRDLPEVRAMGFQFFAREVLVSHAYVRYVECGRPVQVGGLTVAPGDLIHADIHGVLVIPPQIARELPAVAAEIERLEHEMMAYCQSEGFTVDGFIAVRNAVKSRWPGRKKSEMEH